jgi:hypothetical protein
MAALRTQSQKAIKNVSKDERYEEMLEELLRSEQKAEGL